MYLKAINLSNAKLENMLTITKEKDEFTGLRTIRTKLIGLTKFQLFSGSIEFYLLGQSHNIFDSIELIYLEQEDGQGIVTIRVLSLVGTLGYSEWPHWNDSFPFIIDGERISLNSEIKNTFESRHEIKLYDLPVDIFSKICNANEVKFSLRGKNARVEGVFTEEHIKIFKAFEQYCFGDETEANRIIIEIIQNLKVSNADTADDSETQTKQLSQEEIEEVEKKVVDLLKVNKISDANFLYSSNLGCDIETAKNKVIEIANKNGLYSAILKQLKKNQVIALCFYVPILSLLIYSASIPIPPGYSIFEILGPLSTLIFLILVIRSIVILFKK